MIVKGEQFTLLRVFILFIPPSHTSFGNDRFSPFLTTTPIQVSLQPSRVVKSVVPLDARNGRDCRTFTYKLIKRISFDRKSVVLQTPILGVILAADAGQVSPSCMATCHSRVGYQWNHYGGIDGPIRGRHLESEEHSGIRGAYLLLWEGCQLQERVVEAGRGVGERFWLLGRPLEIFLEEDSCIEEERIFLRKGAV